jgi:drug/metabolite transporter (DMT)-like permease
LLTGILAGLAAGALWGLVFVVPRMTPGLSAVDLTAGRFISFGAVALIAMLLTLKSAKLPTVNQALAAAGMSVLGYSGYYWLLAMSITDAGSEVPTLIIGIIPVWMMIWGKPVALRWRALLPGMLLTLVGLALMTSASLQVLGSIEGSGTFWRGVGLATLAMVAWTVFGLVNAAWLAKHPEVSASTWANWLGVATGIGAVLLWWVAGSPVQALRLLENKGWLIFVCVSTGIGSAWLATICWNIASQRLSASLCGQLIVAETIFALIYSFVWDQSWPSGLQLAACALFIAGILASIRAHK